MLRTYSEIILTLLNFKQLYSDEDNDKWEVFVIKIVYNKNPKDLLATFTTYFIE